MAASPHNARWAPAARLVHRTGFGATAAEVDAAATGGDKPGSPERKQHQKARREGERVVDPPFVLDGATVDLRAGYGEVLHRVLRTEPHRVLDTVPAELGLLA